MEKLLLIWKDPDSRTRYTIGELIKNDNEYLFHYVNPELKSALEKKLQHIQDFQIMKKSINLKIYFQIFLADYRTKKGKTILKY